MKNRVDYAPKLQDQHGDLLDCFVPSRTTLIQRHDKPSQKYLGIYLREADPELSRHKLHVTIKVKIIVQ